MTTRKHIEPPHEVREESKLGELVASMENDGWVGRPILAIETADYLQAITGSHRLAASRTAGIDPKICAIVDRRLTKKQIELIEDAVPSLTWRDYWSDTHYLGEALQSAHDDEDRLSVLRVVLGDRARATKLMAAEIEANS